MKIKEIFNYSNTFNNFNIEFLIEVLIHNRFMKDNLLGMMF